MSVKDPRTTSQKGYGWRHQKLRAQLLASYDPLAPCWRCGQPLGEVPALLDLGHVDGDRSRYSGLEHRGCNRSTAGRRAASQAAAPLPERRNCVRDREEINGTNEVLPCICGRLTSRCW